MQDNRLEVQTQFGTLIAEPAGNPDYPGIYLYLAAEDESGEKQELTYALLEAAKDTPRSGETELRLLVYANDDSDDYSHSFVFTKQGQASYDIWVEKKDDGSYSVRVWDTVGEIGMPELETHEHADLLSALSAMSRTARHNPEVQWNFRNFQTG